MRVLDAERDAVQRSAVLSACDRLFRLARRTQRLVACDGDERADPRVEWVNYAGFPDNPHHRLAQKYFGGQACSLLTFGSRGGYEGGTRFYNALKLVKRLVGDEWARLVYDGLWASPLGKHPRIAEALSIVL